MRRVSHELGLVLASILLAGSSMAKELTGAEIKEVISGKTIYLDTTAASATGTPGKGIIYYAADGTALYKTPLGVMWHGNWAIKENSNCSNWKEAPNAGCSKYDKDSDTVTIINAGTGQARGKIVKTAPGNAENLAP